MPNFRKTVAIFLCVGGLAACGGLDDSGAETTETTRSADPATTELTSLPATPSEIAGDCKATGNVTGDLEESLDGTYADAAFLGNEGVYILEVGEESEMMVNVLKDGTRSATLSNTDNTYSAPRNDPGMVLEADGTGGTIDVEMAGLGVIGGSIHVKLTLICKS